MELLTSGEWIFIRGWQASGLREKNGALKIATFLLSCNYQCMTNHFLCCSCGQKKYPLPISVDWSF
jgi:hypothetical protein